MKNVKLNLKKSAKAGFSLVEMLVVIAIIGIIAAIAIPNIGNINQASKDAAAQRNAQQAASAWNAAVSAGFAPTQTSAATALTALQANDVKPGDGPFKDKVFTIGTLDDDAETEALKYLDWNTDEKTLTYVKGGIAP